VAIVCKEWPFVLPEADTTVQEHVRDIPLIFVLIKIVHLVGVTMVYFDIKMHGMDNFKKL